MAPRLHRTILFKAIHYYTIYYWIRYGSRKLKKANEQIRILKKIITGSQPPDKKMMEGKLKAQKRDLRRHHVQRKKAWVHKKLAHYFSSATDRPVRRVGLYSRTPKVCSCFMCGNPRHFFGTPTVQERRAEKFFLPHINFPHSLHTLGRKKIKKF